MLLRLTMPLSIFLTMLAFGCSRSGESSQLSPAPPSRVSMSEASTGNSGDSASGGDSDLIRAAVEQHVREDRGINLSALEMKVDSVNINGDQALASASFRVKQSGATMQVVYSLERHGKGWLVTKDEPAGGQFVHPPMDQVHSGVTPSGSSATGMPDVHEFLNSHPAASSKSSAVP